MKRVLTRCLCVVAVLSAVPALAYDAEDLANDEAALLELHKDVLRYHMENKLDAWMRDESEAYTSANRGHIEHPTIEQRKARLGPYLDQTTFTEYRDLVDPIVKVSNDGSLGWLICQIKVAGEQQPEGGDKVPFEAVWAWIELYEKQDGAWKRIGNVSNRKPPEVAPEHGE